MRRFLQGTLDFHCGVYCVINALSCLHGLDLASARFIFSETILSIAARPDIFKAFTRNNTDHYWVVRYMLARWATPFPYRVKLTQPFGDFLAEETDTPSDFLDSPPLYVEATPSHNFSGSYASTREEARKALDVWTRLSGWLDDSAARVAIFRFHRYLPGTATPVVSHWTTSLLVEGSMLYLHDASGEENSLHCLERSTLLGENGRFVSLRIVPESLVLLEA